MADIFDQITNRYLREKTASQNKSAASVASKYASLTQPLMTRRDYGSVHAEKAAADFLGTIEPALSDFDMMADDLEADNAVQVNTGYDNGLDFTGPGNAEDELVACGENWSDEDILSMGLDDGTLMADDLEADDLEADDMWGEMVADDLEADFIKHSRFKEGPEGSKAYGQAKKNGDIPEEFLEYEGAYDPSSGEMNTERIKENRASLGKTARRLASCGDFGGIVDDMGLDDDMGLEMVGGGDEHEEGSYMSLQNLHEMDDQLEMLTDSLDEGDELEDWVEDKISHAHSALSDVSRYIGYGEHGVLKDKEEEEEEMVLIDDLSEGGDSFKYASMKSTPFQSVSDWFAQSKEESEGELEYLVGVDGADGMSGTVEILSGHNISRLIRDLERDLMGTNIEFSGLGRRTIGWGLPTQKGGIDETSHFRYATDEIIDDLGLNGGDSFRFASARNIRTAKEAGGLFGYPKGIQKAVESAIRKIENRRELLTRAVEDKYPEAGTYFAKRFETSGCNAAGALSKTCVFNKVPARTLGGGLGFKPSCVRACQKSITDLILYSGEVSHGLFLKNKDYRPFLVTYAKKKRCPVAKLLLETMPFTIEG